MLLQTSDVRVPQGACRGNCLGWEQNPDARLYFTADGLTELV
jgi:hypothetical protein